MFIIKCPIYCVNTGDQGSPRGVLEKITTPLKLFDHLKGRCLLSRDNIICLQAMLYHARRLDLFNELLEFAKERGETLHCFPESNTPGNYNTRINIFTRKIPLVQKIHKSFFIFRPKPWHVQSMFHRCEESEFL